MNSNTDELLNKMEIFKNEYYKSEKKNMFVKKKQKLNFAKKMSETFNLEEMIQRTVFIIPGTNKICFDYTVFKLYACPNNYEKIMDYVIGLHDFILLQYPNFEANIILNTFTISAAERYKNAIHQFCNKCITSKYAYLITAINIYYTPSMIDTISALLKPFVDKNIVQRVVFFGKEESPDLLHKLFTPLDNI
jgi:hypothetical protein